MKKLTKKEIDMSIDELKIKYEQETGEEIIYTYMFRGDKKFYDEYFVEWIAKKINSNQFEPQQSAE